MFPKLMNPVTLRVSLVGLQFGGSGLGGPESILGPGGPGGRGLGSCGEGWQNDGKAGGGVEDGGLEGLLSRSGG